MKLSTLLWLWRLQFIALMTLVGIGAGTAKAALQSASFASRVQFPVASGQVSVAFGDLDGDGKPDAVTANYGSGTVSVYRNLSTTGVVDEASFAAPVSFPVSSTPVLVRLADLDGDGRLEIVCVNQGVGSLSILRNVATNGALNSASFAPKVDLSTPSDPRWVAIGDLDGDGRPDLVSATFSSGRLSLFQNTSSAGNISFTPRVDMVPSHSCPVVELADLDGDGHLDLATAYASLPALAVFRNVHAGGALAAESFAAPVSFSSGNGSGVTVADVDGDGKGDLIAANASDNTLALLRNTATAGTIDSNSFASKVTFSTGGYPYSAAVGDLDGDGRTDIVVGNSSSHTLSVFRNVSTNGTVDTGSLQARVDFAAGAGPRIAAIVDVDGDGRLDLAAPCLSQNAFSVLRQVSTNLPPVEVGPGFNLSTGFSIASNPAGVWSYGWKGGVSGPFGLLAEPGAATADNGVSVHAWVLAGVGQPAVYINDSPETGIGAGGQFVMPPGTVWVHPGVTGRPENFGAVRFTAPSNANYLVESAVASIYSGSLSDDNEFRVAVRGVEVFGRFLAANVGTNFSAVVALEAGEVVDFLVGRGANGREYGSALKLAATVTPTTAPAIVVTNTPPTEPVGGAGDFNLARDFSATINPAGPWRYGWKETLAGNLSTDPHHFTATSDNGVAVAGWAANVTHGLPAHYCNTSASTAVIGGGQGVLPPQTFWMHPGANGRPENFGAVRFTAPSNSNYRIETTADSLYTGYFSGDTDYHVVVNGVEVFGQWVPATQGASWSNVVALQAGDTVDFALGRGADGNGWGAGLKVSAIISATTDGSMVVTNPPPPPPPVAYGDHEAGRDFAAGANPSGVWSYGWKGALDGGFTLHPVHFGAVSDNGVLVSGWAANQNYGLPALYCNTAAQTAIIGGGQGVLPPGSLWFHPGANGQPENFGALRFTAPSNAHYRIEAAAGSLYSGSLSGDTDFHVVVNGVAVFDQLLPATQGTGFTNVVELAAGDTVDFAIGRGADGDGYGAGLKLLARLTPTSEDGMVITNPPPGPPVIVSPPPPFLSVPAGGVASLGVTVSGQEPFSYQWLFNGDVIEGAVSSVLVISNVQSVQAGTYRVVVSNVAGAITNSGTVLNVTVAGAGTVIFANQSSNRVYDVGATSLLPAGGSMVAGLFVSTNGSPFLQIGGTAPFILPGRFSGGTKTIPGTSAGQTVELQVRVWDTEFGATFDEAIGGRRGASPTFTVALGGGIQPPPGLSRMSSFALTVPGLAAAQVKAFVAQPSVLRQLFRTPAGWAFMITGTPGTTCAIESSTNLSDWQTVAYVAIDESGLAEFVHKSPSQERGFYRTRLASP